MRLFERRPSIKEAKPQLNLQEKPFTTTTSSGENSPDEGHSAVKQLLKRLNKGWDDRAQVKKKFDVPEFDLNKDDFLEELLPFKQHSIYQQASPAMKKKILTCGWIMYNWKTIAIETAIVNPACVSVINKEIKGLSAALHAELASEAMTDESFHTLLVRRAITITEEKRNINLEIPKFNIVKQLEEYTSKLSEVWQKKLVLIATAVVSEVFISNYLKLLSESKTVQPLNQMVVYAHRQDELVHGKLFKGFGLDLYPQLNQKEKEFFVKVLPLPVRWFADLELDVWLSLLQQIGFQQAETMIEECRKLNDRCVENIDYSEVVKLAEEIKVDLKLDIPVLHIENEEKTSVTVSTP